MLKYISILLIAILAFQQMHKIGIYLQFKNNQTEIAQLFCVKKDIPNNTCQGNCQLSKKIKESEKHEQQLQLSKDKVDILYCSSFTSFAIALVCFFSRKERLYVAYSNLYSFQFRNTIIKPPAA